MNIKCNICGGDVALSADKTFATCEYCGSTITVPKVSDEQRAAAFNRGNHFRRIGEFDKALASYERILREDDTDAEAHWCAALCRFGIEYVEDPATYEWLPTCHRASFDSFIEDVDFKAALEHSDGLTRRLYQKEGAKIAEVQRGILATSQNEEPYDVFLCFKDTGDDGQRTKDSILAQDIYYQLTDQGHRVFFSRITLEDKAGSQYEPYIFAALNSAKVMVAVGTKPEHFSAVWVKNEWSRFLALMRRDRSRVLLPCYRDMDPYDLPEQLAVLQSYDMGKIGFIQDLLRGVDKVLSAGKAVPAAAAAAPVVVQMPVPAALPVQNHDSSVIMGFLDYEMGKKESAIATFRQVLMQDNTCAEAYLGLILASNKSDREAYRAKYQSYASKQMSALEKKVFNQQTQDMLLIEFARMNLKDKTLEALQEVSSEPDMRTFGEVFSVWPEKEIIALFAAKDAFINNTVFADSYNDNDGIGDAPLISYVYHRTHSLEAIRVLLECGAEPNQWRWIDGDYFRPLYDCIKSNDLDTTKLLLEYGAKPDKDFKKNGVEYPMLYECVLDRNLDAMNLLLEHSARTDAVFTFSKQSETTESTLLGYAVEMDDIEVTSMLIKYGADVNSVIKKTTSAYVEYSPLFAAISHNSVEMVRLLLAHGADTALKRIQRMTNNGVEVCTRFTATNECILRDKSKEILELLLASGANPHDTSTHWQDGLYLEINALSLAVNLNKYKMAELLLDHGADPNAEWVHYQTPAIYIHPLYDAVTVAKNTSLVKLLLEHGANPNYQYQDRNPNATAICSILSIAICQAKSKGIVEVLLKHGADPSFVVKKVYKSGRVEKESLLHQAVMYSGSQEIFILLVKSGASLDVPTTNLKNCKDVPFRRYPYEVDSSWKRTLSTFGWKGPGLFGNIF